MIDISGLDRADVLAALYNVAKPQGMGFLHYDPKPMTREEAIALLAGWRLDQKPYFDYLKGRVMKSEIAGNTFDERLFDRDNGSGSAALAIATLRETANPNAASIANTHRANTLDAALDVEGRLDTKASMKTSGGIAVFTVGLADVAPVLAPAIIAAKAVGAFPLKEKKMSFKITVTETKLVDADMGSKWALTGEQRADGSPFYGYTPALPGQKEITSDVMSCQLAELDVKRLMEFLAKGY